MQVLIYEGLNIFWNICICQGGKNIVTYKITQETFQLNFPTSLNFTQQFLRKDVTCLTLMQFSFYKGWIPVLT